MRNIGEYRTFKTVNQANMGLQRYLVMRWLDDVAGEQPEICYALKQLVNDALDASNVDIDILSFTLFESFLCSFVFAEYYTEMDHERAKEAISTTMTLFVEFVLRADPPLGHLIAGIGAQRDSLKPGEA